MSDNYENNYGSNFDSYDNSGVNDFAQDGSYHFKGTEIPTDESSTYNSYNSSSYHSGYTSQSYTDESNGYGSYTSYNNYSTQPAEEPKKAKKPKKEKKKKERKPVSRATIALIMFVAILFSGALGFGGGYVATMVYSHNNGLVVNKSATSANGTSVVTGANASGLTTQIVNQTADSVVEITTETVSTGSFFQQYISTGAGSGVIISDDGYILTNNHVIDGANNVMVTLRDGTDYEAEVIGKDAALDIALIKVDAKDLTAATFGDSSEIMVGDYAVVIGNPLGQLGGTVTDGIISALDRDVIIDGETMSLMQTNAAINPGNSGGGLFNAEGELIGIICAKASSSTTEVEGLGFAIPINDVLDVLNDLKEHGYVTGRIDLGMTLTDIASNQVYQAGVYVSGVTKGSCADDAGFKSGDLITAINGKDVESVAEVKAIIEELSIGDNVKFSVTRGSKSGTLTMTLEEYAPSDNALTNDSNDQFSPFEDDYSEWNPYLW